MVHTYLSKVMSYLVVRRADFDLVSAVMRLVERADSTFRFGDSTRAEHSFQESRFDD
jgi:hypothetical protein